MEKWGGIGIASDVAAGASHAANEAAFRRAREADNLDSLRCHRKISHKIIDMIEVKTASSEKKLKKTASRSASAGEPNKASADAAPRHRSGAVARMLRMPVATLRVWERRYGVSRPALSPSGHRLYSDTDVRRLTLLKQLTDVGHAIGSLAALDMAQLQQVASTHAHVLVATQVGDGSAPVAKSTGPAWRLAVIGATLGTRLQRPALLRRLGRPLVVLGPYADVKQAASALQSSAVDALLIQEPHLQEGWLTNLNAIAPGIAALPKAVLYHFATDAMCEALASAGTLLLREPQPDAVLAQWLASLATATRVPAPAVQERPFAQESVPPRRWSDAALADFAGLSTTIACECPRHVAELLVQLSQFEEYSAQCEHRNAADAELHAYLRQVAYASRARFEAALEYVALHEGLILPA